MNTLFKLVKGLVDYIVYILCNILEQPLIRSVHRDILKNTVGQNGIVKNVQAIHRMQGKVKKKRKRKQKNDIINISPNISIIMLK